jgi:hypothetical protein
MTREELAAVGFPYCVDITGLDGAPGKINEYLDLLIDGLLEERARVDRLTSDHIRMYIDTYDQRRSAAIKASDEAARSFRETGRR